MSDQIKLPYLQWVKAKGIPYAYYRRNGIRQRIEGAPGSLEFMNNYTRIHASFEAAPKMTGAAPGTFEYLIRRYYASGEFRDLKDRTHADYRAYIEIIREAVGKFPVASFKRAAVKKLRDKFADTPTKANNLVKVLRLLLQFAIDDDVHGVEVNVARNIKKLKTGPGWRAWPAPALERGHDLLNGVCRVGFMLALYTGQRKGDWLSMGWDALEKREIDGIVIRGVNVRQEKTGKVLWVPLHPVLVAELAKVRRQTKGLAIVARRDGRRLTVSGFNGMWRRQQKKHGFIGLQLHGLRRNAVNMLLEAGASVPETAAITGQSFEMVQHYAQEVNQNRMAAKAMNKLRTSSGKPSGKLKVVGGTDAS